MSIAWSAFRQELRVAMLNDNPTDVNKRRWSDAQLLIFLKWAQDTLCAHTALPKSVTFSAAVGDQHWTVPTDIYRQAVSLEEYGLISLQPTNSGVKENFYNPRGKTKNAGPGATGNYFYVDPSGEFYLTQPLSAAGSIIVRYFAYFPLPAADSDLLRIPEWSVGPISYLIAANAFASFSMDAANIKMWAEAPEKGSPESNPFRAQQKWNLEIYEREIARVPIQERVNYYRYS